MRNKSILPPGQRVTEVFPRFGLSKFATRFPEETEAINICVGGDTEEFVIGNSELSGLKRIYQVSDFHCVTTWSMRGLSWSGFSFADFYHTLVVPQLNTHQNIEHVLIRGQDGYRTCMRLEDLLTDSVLLADRLNDRSLTVSHGAPLRLVAPAHYGYKSVKHICSLQFFKQAPDFKRAAYKFMDHPRARVEHEERGLIFPGWLLRRLYRPLVASTVREFKQALDHYENRV